MASQLWARRKQGTSHRRMPTRNLGKQISTDAGTTFDSTHPTIQPLAPPTAPPQYAAQLINKPLDSHKGSAAAPKQRLSKVRATGSEV
eukprot:1156806-Pelagomonas_calceolata.AAC.7